MSQSWSFLMRKYLLFRDSFTLNQQRNQKNFCEHQKTRLLLCVSVKVIVPHISLNGRRVLIIVEKFPLDLETRF